MSDTPAWKVSQAQLIAQFRGWAPFIGLQIEYSLLERTVEGELIPMALELGLGVTPWSPLKSGVLSGKYARQDSKQVTADRHWIAESMNERTFALLDELGRLARQLDTTVARVALAWALTKPVLGFPAAYLPGFAGLHSGGLTINGERAETTPFSVARGDKTY